MFAGDADAAALRLLPGFGDPLQSFQSEVESASDSYLTTGLVKFAAKEKALQLFDAALLTLRTACAAESVSVIEAFQRTKKRALKVLLASRPSVDEEDLEPLKAALADLADALMDLEVRQVERFEDLLSECVSFFPRAGAEVVDQARAPRLLQNRFERQFSELKQACLDAQQGFFRIVEEHEANYYKASILRLPSTPPVRSTPRQYNPLRRTARSACRTCSTRRVFAGCRSLGGSARRSE
jgi:hypothetical protein